MASRRQDLFLQVSGNVAPLSAAMKTGKSVLAEFGTGAVNVLEEVERALGDLGRGGAPGLKEIERSYDATFKRIRENAQAVIAAPSGQAAVQIIDANATREAAEAAERKATAFRLVAEAANRADQAQNGNSAATRAYAVAAAVAATEAEQEANALRQQAVVLGQVEAQLESTGVAQRRVNIVSGAARAGYQQLSFQLGDVATQYASGTAASLIFAQQSGQVIQALTLIQGEAKGIIGFLGGPWGVAISAALVALTPFVAKLLEESDASKEARKATEEHAEAVKRLGDAKRNELRTAEQKLLADYAEIANERAKAVAIRQTTQARLADARAALQALSQPGVAQERGVGVARNAAQDQISALERELATNTAELRRLQGSETAAAQVYLRGRADTAATPEGRVRARYDRQIADAATQFAGNLAGYSAKVRELNAARDAEIKALQASTRAQSSSANRQFGREIDTAGARRIIEGIGGRVTSDDRSAAKQRQLYADFLAGRLAGPVAKPGTSAHERGGAIDVAYGPGINVASIRKAFADEGVKLKKILDEKSKRIFHVEFGKAGPAGPSADTVARRAEAEGDRKVRDADEYANLLAGVKDQQLRLERQRVLSIGEAAALDREAVERERADIERAAQKGVELEKWTQAEADAVKAVAAQNAEIEKQAISRRELSAALDQQLNAERAEIGRRADLLQLEGDLANTSKKRREIALKLLALEQEALRKAANKVLNDPSSTPEQRSEATAALAQLDREKPLREEAIRRQTAGPLESYRLDLERMVGSREAIEEQLEGVGARGLQSLEDGLLDIITGTEDVGAAFKKMANAIIADLLRIAVQKFILNIITGGFAGGGKVDGFAGGGRIERFAGGGMIRGPGTGTSDSILALVGGERPILVSNGEAIVNERGVRNHWPLIDAINKDTLPRFAQGGLVAAPGWTPRLPSLRRAEDAAYGRREKLEVDVRARVDAGPEFDARIERTSARMIGAAAEPIMAGAENRTLRRMRRATLPGAPG